MNRAEKNNLADKEIYQLQGEFKLQTFLLEDAKSIFLENNATGERLRLNRNGYGNNGSLTYDLETSDGHTVLLPIFTRYDESSTKGSKLSFKIDSFEFKIDEMGNLQINCGDQYKLEIDNEPMDDILAIANKISAPLQVEKFGQIERGGSGSLYGDINNGKKFAISSMKSTTNGYYQKYALRNEDSAGVNKQTGRMIVTDGLGGHGQGDMTAFLATEEILSAWDNLEDSIDQARTALSNYVTFYGNHMRPDVVLVACDVKGDKAEIARIGDCKWLMIRKGKIEKQSDYLTNEAEENIYKNKIFPTLSSTLLINSETTWAEIDLQEGDVILMFSDGYDGLTEEEILKCVEGNDPEKISAEMLALATQKNSLKSYQRKLKNGSTATTRGPFDNLSVIVYKH